MKHLHLDLLTYWKILVYKYNRKYTDHEDAMHLINDLEFFIKDDSYCVTTGEAGVSIELFARDGEIYKSEEIPECLLKPV